MELTVRAGQQVDGAQHPFDNRVRQAGEAIMDERAFAAFLQQIDLLEPDEVAGDFLRNVSSDGTNLTAT